MNFEKRTSQMQFLKSLWYTY